MKINPSSAIAANNPDWIFATSPDDALRIGSEALVWGKKLEPLQHPIFLNTFAAACAEVGPFEMAQETARIGSLLAEKIGDWDVADRLSQREPLYSAHQPYRDAIQSN